MDRKVHSARDGGGAVNIIEARPDGIGDAVALDKVQRHQMYVAGQPHCRYSVALIQGMHVQVMAVCFHGGLPFVIFYATGRIAKMPPQRGALLLSFQFLRAGLLWGDHLFPGGVYRLGTVEIHRGQSVGRYTQLLGVLGYLFPIRLLIAESQVI